MSPRPPHDEYSALEGAINTFRQHIGPDAEWLLAPAIERVRHQIEGNLVSAARRGDWGRCRSLSEVLGELDRALWRQK